jgi:outer membrane protein assembly factor BamB
LVVNPDGSFFIGLVYDSLNNKTNYNAAVAAFDSTGQMLWFRDLPKGTQTNDWLNQLIPASGNRLWAIGQIQRNGFERGMVVALDATTGQIQFTNLTDSLVSGTDVHRIGRGTLTPSGDLIVAGQIRGFSANSGRAALWKFSVSGDSRYCYVRFSERGRPV